MAATGALLDLEIRARQLAETLVFFPPEGHSGRRGLSLQGLDPTAVLPPVFYDEAKPYPERLADLVSAATKETRPMFDLL